MAKKSKKHFHSGTALVRPPTGVANENGNSQVLAIVLAPSMGASDWGQQCKLQKQGGGSALKTQLCDLIPIHST